MTATHDRWHFASPVSLFAALIIFAGIVCGMPGKSFAEAVYFSENMDGVADASIDCEPEAALCAIVFRPSEQLSGIDVVRVRLGTTTAVSMQVYELENATTSINVGQVDPTPPYYGPMIAESANAVEIISGGTDIAEFLFPDGLTLSPNANTHYAFVLQTADRLFVLGKLDPSFSFRGWFGQRYHPETGESIFTPNTRPSGGDPGPGGCVGGGSPCGLFSPALELADSTASFTSPVVTLLGDDPMIVVQGSEFSDPGATATDDEDGDLTDSIVVEGEVNTEDPGEYILSYSVTDSTGLSASVNRTVVVVPVDPNTVDTDGDGIMDSVDAAPDVYSDDFTDGVTFGTITSRGGQNVLVEDSLAAEEGVVLSSVVNLGVATGTPATVHVCDAAAITLTDGDKVVVTCGSVILDVLEGEVEAELFAENGLTSLVHVPAGNEVTFLPDENTIAAAPENTSAISATSGGEDFVVTPGATISLTPATMLTALHPAEVWIGLKNSDAVGIKFDLLVEVYNGDTLISSGQLHSVSGGSSGFNNAKLNIIPFNSFSPVDMSAGSNLNLKLFVRNTCNGPTHNSGTARLWFNDVAADSHFGADKGGSADDYFLRNGFVLTEAAGAGPKKTIDVAAGTPCSAFKSFGTWTITL